MREKRRNSSASGIGSTVALAVFGVGVGLLVLVAWLILRPFLLSSSMGTPYILLFCMAGAAVAIIAFSSQILWSRD